MFLHFDKAGDDPQNCPTLAQILRDWTKSISEILSDKPVKDKEDPEKEYKKQQKKLALQYGVDEEDKKSVNFPNLRNR